MAQLLKQPTPTPAGRVPSMLPSVKCSSCGRPVPVDELGDHVCPPPSSAPSLPRPQHSPQSAAALLPPRLQNLANGGRSPAAVHVPSPLRSAPVVQDPRSFQNKSSPLSTNAPSAPWNQPQRSNSPLGRSHPQQVPVSANPTLSQQRAQSPFTAQRDDRRDADRNAYRPPASADPRNATRPSYDNDPRTASPQLIPRQNEIDTKIGGEAGMAGVGRRGFAAAARAAMFTTHSPAPTPTPRINNNNNNNFIPEMDARRANAPRYLDIDSSNCEFF
jgi:PDZ and LIM domain protein 5/6/7